MFKGKQLHNWIWKWHILAGLFSLPFLFLLSVTGAIYLFKGDYEQSAYRDVIQVEKSGERLSYQQLLENATTAAKAESSKKPSKIILPQSETDAVEFQSGRFSSKRSTYVDPYSGEVTGSWAVSDTLMQKVRKLHGELLLGKQGTLVIELVASWLVVLVITGVYVWWPRGQRGIRGLFTVRFNAGKRVMYRDLHAVTGFWVSGFLLLILAGGMPWTEVFGSNFKWLRDNTGSGYPSAYSGRGLKSAPSQGAAPLSLDEMVAIARKEGLKGTVTLTFPKKANSVFSIRNRSEDLNQQWSIHYDQYTGAKIKAFPWSEVGAMSNGRQIVMRIHQGEFFGSLNWGLVLATAVLLALMSLSAMASYLIRKPKGSWGIPKVPAEMRVGKGVFVLLAILAMLLPLFGASLLLLVAVSFLTDWRGKRRERRLA
ncbi:PepSY-associated TM helix domain-containing protein [Veronia pacifica]|uniref:Peptidase n=1 Tax=Veronia pacifica TaxID=1080227 RepID=A0A1C3EB76_9GAMM|nr:PepSY domain-containing protein [Veronia pacifica]ODA30493.1 peptidase [Veronia pacifica]